MIYACSDIMYAIPLEEIPKTIRQGIRTIAYLSLQEFQQIAPGIEIKQSTIDLHCKPSIHFRSSFIQTEESVFGSFQMINLENIMESSGKIGIFMTKNYCLLVNLGEDDPEVAHVFERAVSRCKSDELTVEKVLYLFFETLVMEDAARLEDIEFEFDVLEDRIVAKKVEEEFYQVLILKKRELFVLHNYYEQFLEFVDVLEENRQGLFEGENKKYLQMMEHKFSRLKQNTLQLRESMVQLREAYQAYLDYSLNSVMKLFTVVTTIFVPLSLIVGWYGMNFTSMPELKWKYGYAYVIGLTAVIVLLCIWVFKKKKLI